MSTRRYTRAQFQNQRVQLRKRLTAAIARAVHYDEARLRRGMRMPGRGMWTGFGGSQFGNIEPDYDVQAAWRAWRQAWIEYLKQQREDLYVNKSTAPGRRLDRRKTHAMWANARAANSVGKHDVHDVVDGAGI